MQVESMPYKFVFDLSNIPKSFFVELAKAAGENALCSRIGIETCRLAQYLAKITGLEEPETLQLVKDLMDVYSQNISERKHFVKTKNRALLLPHCSRKFMDSRCKATFNPETPSYVCSHCSEDCLINGASKLGNDRGYDVYVLPGGSCIINILKKNKCEGVVGVACGQEVKLGVECLKQMGYAGQAIPLIRNGCANTSFNLESLEKML
jgi:hypothetical protein